MVLSLVVLLFNWCLFLCLLWLTAHWLPGWCFCFLLQLDSVTSLIQAAKNLMNSVVQTVKMSYIASTKIIKIQSPTGPRHPVVMWRMKAPEKKPLIKREKPEEIYAAVRKGSAKKRIHPVQVMSEFRGRVVWYFATMFSCLEFPMIFHLSPHLLTNYMCQRFALNL